MKFNKEHLADIDSLDEIEAEAFITFLGIENGRHRRAIKIAKEYIKTVGFIEEGEETKTGKTFTQLWQSAIKRHQEDIKKDKEQIKKIKGRFGW